MQWDAIVVLLEFLEEAKHAAKFGFYVFRRISVSKTVVQGGERACKQQEAAKGNILISSGQRNNVF